MDDPTIATYPCPHCQSPLTRRSGIVVTGVCDVCGRKVEFELPPNAIEELTDDLIAARKTKAAADQDFEARKIFAIATAAADQKPTL
jgi:uncharacterized Zn finger protein (UPF0148 family)